MWYNETMTNEPHYHRDERGLLVRCYHKTRLSWKAWVLAGVVAMLAYPVEHTIWERVPPFNTVAEWLGIGLSHGHEEEHEHDEHDKKEHDEHMDG